MLNWDLMRHPLNWIIVLLMLTIAGIAGHLLLTHFGAEPQGSSSPDSMQLPPGEMSKADVAAQILG